MKPAHDAPLADRLGYLFSEWVDDDAPLNLSLYVSAARHAIAELRLEERSPVTAIETDYEGAREAMAAMGDPLDPMPAEFTVRVSQHGPTSIGAGWPTPMKPVKEES